MKTILLCMMVLLAASPRWAQAQDNAIFVTEISQNGIEPWAYAGLAHYDWPGLGQPTRRPDIPEHDALALSLDNRSLFLFSRTQVRVLDPVSMQTQRVIAVVSPPPSPWAWKALISPAHPEIVMMSNGYWFNTTTGQFTQTPSTLAPGFDIWDSTLDDAGRYLTLSLSRDVSENVRELSLRVINLDGSDVAQRDIPDAFRGLVLPGGRVVVSRSGVRSALDVLDLATLSPRSTLNFPAGYVTALSGDGRGGVVAVTEQASLATRHLLHWPDAQSQPILIRTDISGGYSSTLRVQNARVLLLQQQPTVCLIVCFLGPSNLTVFDPAQGTTQSITSEASPLIADAALLPLGRLPSPIPTLAPLAAVFLGLLMIAVGWRFQRARVGAH